MGKKKKSPGMVNQGKKSREAFDQGQERAGKSLSLRKEWCVGEKPAGSRERDQVKKNLPLKKNS